MPRTLYLVATPIGNLQDMSSRAIETLKSVDIIACEDTRRTRKLLNHFGISNKLISYHEHNENERADELARMLEEGRSIAVVSDAGTPGINDPAYKIVVRAHEIGIRVVAIPGAVAFVNAVVVSGLPTDTLFFGGFLPSRKGERRKRLEEVKNIPATLVFYESPHRLAKSLADCLDVLGDRKARIVRELTKIHEEVISGSLASLASQFSDTTPRGEFVLVIDRSQSTIAARGNETLAGRVRELESEGFEPMAALKKAAREFGIGKSEAYRILQSEMQKPAR